jgi:LysM repeat protein
LRSSNPAVQEALKRYQAGQRIEARQELNRLLHSPLPEADKDEIRAHLARIASETIFSRSRVEGDPLVDTYTVQRGDRLVHVARRYDIPHEAIMHVNGIHDPARIAEGMKLAVPRGPFHARIYKSRFRLDLYLQDLYVRSFPVGLGVDSGTPTGTWRVKNRQPNPTYYPPPSAPDRRVIPPNDPKNPLGEYWIGLEGIEGEAFGKEGYGIHGTIEPETIGRNASLGCVRMREEDVALLFRLLQVGKSTVTIYP